MNLENCLRNELPPNLDWLRNQLIDHMKELRDRARKGEMLAVLHEFFDCYRFDDNQLEPDGFWFSEPKAFPDTPSNKPPVCPEEGSRYTDVELANAFILQVTQFTGNAKDFPPRSAICHGINHILSMLRFSNARRC